MKLSSGNVVTAQRLVIYGPSGVGKTTFAGRFPGALILDIENGSKNFAVSRVEEIRTLDDVNEALAYAAGEPAVETVAIDTADWLEPMLDAAFIKGWNERNCAKYASVSAVDYYRANPEWLKYCKAFLKSMDALLPDKTVVFLAHSKVARFDPPDNMRAAYNRYELNCSKQFSDALTEWCDAKLFMTREVLVEEKRNGQVKARGGVTRLIYPAYTAFADAKNRWGLEEPFEADFEVLRPHVAPAARPAPKILRPSGRHAAAEGASPEPDGDDIPMASTYDRVREFCAREFGARTDEYIARAAAAWKWIGEGDDPRQIPEEKLRQALQKPELFVEYVNKIIMQTNKNN